MQFSEADTRAKFIDPKLRETGWEEFTIREYYFTEGRKLLGGKRSIRLYADYLLKYKNVNLAIIEAKRLDKHPTEGLQQAIGYADKLKVKYVYASNGEQIYEFDMQVGKGDYIDTFPAPEELYNRSFKQANDFKEKLLSVPFYLTRDKTPRYYQEIAVNRAVEARVDSK